MARIPNALSIKRATPSGAQGVARAPSVDVEGAFNQLGAVLKDQAEDLSRHQMAKANVDFLVAKTEFDGAFVDDDDFATIPNRYEAGVSEKLGELAANIPDARLREEFVQHHRVGIARGVEDMRGLARGKQHDFERASTSEKLNDLNGIVAKGTDEAAFDALDAKNLILDSAVESNLYSHEDRAKISRAWDQKSLALRVQGMTPEDQVDALKQPMFKKLDPAVRLQLETAAKEGVVQNRAFHIVDQEMQLGLDSKQAWAKHENITDLDLRRAVQRESDYRIAKKRRGDVEASSKFYEEYHLFVREEGLTVDNIKQNNPDQWVEMTPNQRNSLYAAEQASLTPERKYSDESTEHMLNNFLIQKDFVGLREFFLKDDTLDKLTRTDRVKWNKVTLEEVVPREVESILSIEKIIDVEMGIPNSAAKRDRKNKVLEHIKVWHDAYQENEQKDPSDKEVEAELDRALFKFDPGVFSTEKYLFELEDDDKLGDPDLFDDVAEMFTTLGVEPDRDQFHDAFRELKERRNVP